MKQQRVQYYGDAIYWTFNSKWHRDGDLPTSYYFRDGKLDSVFYRQHGKNHRTTGPAYIDNKNQIKEYWYQNRRYDSLEEIQMLEACK